MNRSDTVVLAIMISCLLPGCSTQTTRRAAQVVPAWTPSADVGASLDSPSKVGKYEVRPPKGYQLQEDSHGVARGFLWQSSPSDDKKTAKFHIVLAPLNDQEQTLSAEQVVQRALAALENGPKAKLTSKMPTEVGTVNGLRFARVRFSVSETLNNKLVQGQALLYACVDGATSIMISGSAIDQDKESTLKLLEGAALTFRKP